MVDRAVARGGRPGHDNEAAARTALGGSIDAIMYDQLRAKIDTLQAEAIYRGTGCRRLLAGGLAEQWLHQQSSKLQNDCHAR